MPDLNNPITDAFDEMISRGSSHMTIEPGYYNELLISEQPVDSLLPPMDNDEIIEDLKSLGVDITVHKKGSYLYFHHGTTKMHKLRFFVKELPKTFFITFTCSNDISNRQKAIS